MAENILMVTWDGAGNIPPELGLCRALVDKEYRVQVLTHDSLESRVVAAGAEFVPIVRAGQLDARRDDNEAGRIDELVERVFLSPGLAADIDDAIERIAPAAVVGDSMMLLPLAIAKQRNLPTIGFHHTLADFLFGGPFGAFSGSMKEPLNAILGDRGLAPYEQPMDALANADAILSATYSDFDSTNDAVPDNFVYMGSCRDEVSAASDAPARRFPDRPLIVVSLSTSFMDQVALLQKLVDAVAGLEVEALVTTGLAIGRDALTPAANVSAVEFVPHENILPNTDLLITHAGHGTVLAGITYGVPMLCLPMGRDQHQVAARASELGLAHVADQAASVAELTQAITRAIEDVAMSESIERFSQRARRHPGLEAGVACIEGLIV